MSVVVVITYLPVATIMLIRHRRLFARVPVGAGSLSRRNCCRSHVPSEGFMSGRRPDTTQVWHFYQNFRTNERGADWTSLPQNFKRNGCLTMGTGTWTSTSVPDPNLASCARCRPAGRPARLHVVGSRPHRLQCCTFVLTDMRVPMLPTPERLLAFLQARHSTRATPSSSITRTRGRSMKHRTRSGPISPAVRRGGRSIQPGGSSSTRPLTRCGVTTRRSCAETASWTVPTAPRLQRAASGPTATCPSWKKDSNCGT